MGFVWYDKFIMAKIQLLDFWAPWCIDPQTPVLTENGYIKASQVKIGQKLVTIDPKTKKQSVKKVQKIRIFKDVASKKIVLETGRELIGDTNHQVLTQEGFKKLEELVIGEKILVNPVDGIEVFRSDKAEVILETTVQKAVFQQLALDTYNRSVIYDLHMPVVTFYPQQKRRQNNLFWEKVSSLEDVENRDVIGITVSNPHTIVTNGIVSHNCGPCRIMNPILEELEKELGDKVTVEKINVDENQELASKYGVMSIPTYIVLKDDKEVGRKIGVTSKADLLKLLQS